MRWNQKWLTVGVMCCFFLATLGHGSGNPPGPTPASAAVNATTLSLQSMLVSLHFGLDTMKPGDSQEASSARAFKQSQMKDLAAAVAGFLRATTLYDTHTAPCMDAETINSIETLTGMKVPLPKCPPRFENKDWVGDAKVSTSGSVNFSRTNNKFTLMLDNFQIATTHMADGSVLEEVLNLTVAGTVDSTTLCKEQEVPNSVAAKINGTFSRKIDENADGVWEEDTQGDFDNFALGLSVEHFDPNSCAPTNFVVSESGIFAFTDNTKPSDAFTLDISQNAPAVITWETAADGVHVTANGRFMLTSSCMSGSLTLNTTEALVFPVLGADRGMTDCPTFGVMTVTGDQTTTVTFTSSGGIEIDRNGDGVLDESFENCHDANFCP